MTNFAVKQADLTIELAFEKPALSLLGNGWQRPLELIYRVLERYGLSPKEITFGQSGSVGDRYLMFFLPRINGGVKVYISKVEFGFNNTLLATFEDLQTIIAGVTHSLKTADDDVRFTGWLATYNVHGDLAGTNAAKFLGGLLPNRPKGLGPDTGGALGFYYGTEGPRMHLAIIMDGSVVVPNGLYMRLTTAFDGKRVDVNEVLKAGREEFRKAFAALNLSPQGIDLGAGN